jgi:hypothetical protein
MIFFFVSGILRKDAYDAGFFSKVRGARAVRSVQEAEQMTNDDARLM